MRRVFAAREALAHKLVASGATAGAITRGHAEALLALLDDLPSHRPCSTGPALLDSEESELEAEYRAAAADAHAQLPLDAMRDELGLDTFETEVLVLCASIELDTGYEVVLSLAQDDPARRAVSIELACSLTDASLEERVSRRASLGPFGRLRRLGLVTVAPRDSGLRDELRLTPACFEALLGTPLDLPLAFRDPGAVELSPPRIVPADAELVERAAKSMRAGRIDVIGIWGPPRLAREVIAALLVEGELAVRRYTKTQGDVAAAANTAAALGAVLWIDIDALGDVPADDVLEVCRRTRVPLIVTGASPWRPTELLASRGFVELSIVTPDSIQRAAVWREELPDVAEEDIARTAASYRFDAMEIEASARMARATAALQTNGHVVTTTDALPASCLAVARKHGERHTTLVIPRRGQEDLVLSPDLHARVLDLVRYFRALPRVMDEWGFTRRASSAGIKALFTGEPGTGKTLAAEVIATELRLPMLKVDLARVVSRWVGETEKNLDHVFNEALDSHAVLFFDEAEALFGARGDVRHGTDRYANLEVSYLLQRLEAHTGVVLLATNLRDKIDGAFMRRFHAVIGFPRPSEKERRRIWQRVFTPAVPMAGDIDMGLLARLDLTGAGIVGAAQIAALLAADENTSVSMRHVVRGLVRQFQREARVLTSKDLGEHAIHMGV